MLQPFYSENSTVDKTRSFWDEFERAKLGLSDTLHLSDFETLRTRFQNQFICQTPKQMIERLKTMKRSRRMSAEAWRDLISGLCDAAQCYDPQMRYQYVLAGLWNKDGRAALSTTMVNSILQAVAVLLYKNMHLPIEDESEFANEPTQAKSGQTALLQQLL
ncbi:Hypothetical protein PHPALM_1723 [Phytophthora palmivora]|uniref:Uncharacterized protein n=1 Tax=Phytophthora palmivora TaxID=4796 RepID=A0A2P4YRL8_9STRA|nr:Hypothetical protein PHPALM_1723 [Phytophthora palmivora]